MEVEKRYDRILLVAKELKEKGVDFNWYLVGDGNLIKKHRSTCEDMGLSDRVIFTGYMSNACPLLKQCDLFVLMSEYEGTPVTIDEAKVLGIPVLAKNVGGIEDQLKDGAGQALDTISADDIADFDFASHKKSDRQKFEEYNNQVIAKIKSMLE